MSTYLRLLQYLFRYKYTFLLSVFGFAIFALSQPALAKLMEIVVEAIEGEDAAARYVLPMLAVGIFVLRGIGSFLGSYFNAYVGACIVRDLKSEVFRQMVVLPEHYYLGTTQGQILHKLNTGVERVRASITSALKTLISEGLTIIALLVYIFYLNWQLSLIFLGLAPVLFGLVRYSARRFSRIARKNEAALGKAMQVSKELASNYSVVRVFGAQRYETARYDRAVASAFKNQMKIRRVQSIVTPVTQLIVAMGVALVVFLLLSPETLATHTTGELLGYLTAVALVPKPLRQLSGVQLTIQRGIIGADLVFELLDADAERDEGSYEADEVRGKIEFRDVRFTYPGSSEPTMK